jgi:hypothetical protein
MHKQTTGGSESPLGLTRDPDVGDFGDTAARVPRHFDHCHPLLVGRSRRVPVHGPHRSRMPVTLQAAVHGVAMLGVAGACVALTPKNVLVEGSYRRDAAADDDDEELRGRPGEEIKSIPWLV